MTNFKKYSNFITIILSFTVVFFLTVSCGDKSEKNESKNDSNTESEFEVPKVPATYSPQEEYKDDLDLLAQKYLEADRLMNDSNIKEVYLKSRIMHNIEDMFSFDIFIKIEGDKYICIDPFSYSSLNKASEIIENIGFNFSENISKMNTWVSEYWDKNDLLQPVEIEGTPRDFVLKRQTKFLNSFMKYYISRPNVSFTDAGFNSYNETAYTTNIDFNTIDQRKIMDLTGKFLSTYKDQSDNLFALSYDENGIYLSPLKLMESHTYKDYMLYEAEKPVLRMKVNPACYSKCKELWRIRSAYCGPDVQEIYPELEKEDVIAKEYEEEYGSKYYPEYRSKSDEDIFWLIETDQGYALAGNGKDIFLDYANVDLYISVDSDVYESVTDKDYRHYIVKRAFEEYEGDTVISDLNLKMLVAEIVSNYLNYVDSDDVNIIVNPMNNELQEFLKNLIYARHGNTLDKFDQMFVFESLFGYINREYSYPDDDITPAEKQFLKNFEKENYIQAQ